MSPIDFGKTAVDYRRHRVGFPDDYFARIAQYGIGVANQQMLDLGTGTGTLARGFARRGCRVTGLDPSINMMEQAKELDADAGVDIRYVEAAAEQTGLPNACFDVVTAGQCWHWFKRGLAAAEANRLLRPGGALVISHFDWLPLPGNVVHASETLVLKHNPAWAGAGAKGVYPNWFADLMLAGFCAIESFSFDIDVRYSHEAWRGRLRASAGIAASLDPDAVAQFDCEHAALLAGEFPVAILSVPHRVFTVLGRKPCGD